jgi:hypothetical protein
VSTWMLWLQYQPMYARQTDVTRQILSEAPFGNRNTFRKFPWTMLRHTNIINPVLRRRIIPRKYRRILKGWVEGWLSWEGQEWDQRMEVVLLGSNHFHKWSLRLPQWWVSGEGKRMLSLFHIIASWLFDSQI